MPNFGPSACVWESSSISSNKALPSLRESGVTAGGYVTRPRGQSVRKKGLPNFPKNARMKGKKMACLLKGGIFPFGFGFAQCRLSALSPSQPYSFESPKSRR